MPILWQYLLSNYSKILLFSVLGFICVLMATKLDDIARFATFGNESLLLLRFVLLQIPYILPIAIPIGCLLSAFILFQHLSLHHELTALRASGLSILQVAAPVLLAGVFVGLVNLYIISEAATRSHLKTRQLEVELRSLNPLILVQQAKNMRAAGAYVNILGNSKPGEEIGDLVMAMKSRHLGRIQLFLSKHLTANDKMLTAEDVSLIGSLADDEEVYDHLFMENISSLSTTVEELSQLIRRKGWRLSTDHLKISLLLTRIHDLYTKSYTADEAELPSIYRALNKALSEVSRRLSVAFATFAFTLMGVAFGISISRRESRWNIIQVITLAALYLAGFFLGKGLASNVFAATLLYTLPLILIVVCCYRRLQQLSRGAVL